MPELKFTAGLDASGVDAGAKKIQQALAGIAKDANKLDSSIDLSGIGSGLIKGAKSIGQFNAQLTRFRVQLEAATDPKDILRLNKAIDASVAKIKTLNSVGAQAGASLGSGVAKGANTAGQSLQNLGRIAQDAPFGFIGIQNNINPLIESFQRLKVETGSTGGALKALVGSLAGAGGIGLAVSVATGLLTVLATNGFFKSEKAADSAAEANKRYKETIQGIFAGVAKEATEVVSLIAVLKSETETRERKLQALKDLAKINPEIFKGLTLEKGAVQGVDAAYRAYIESLKTVIAVKIIQAELDQKIEKLLKAQGIAQNNVTKGAIAAGKAIAALNSKGQFNVGGVKPIEIIVEDRELRLLNQDIEDLSKRLTELSKGVKIDIDDPLKEKVPRIKKDVETISDVLAELSREIDFLNAKGIAFNTNEAKAQISAITFAIEKLIKDFKVKPDDTIIKKLFGGGTIKNDVKGFNIPGIEGLREKAQDLIKKEFAEPIKPIIFIRPEVDIPPNISERVVERMRRSIMIQEGIDKLAGEMQDVIANSFGNAITQGITGTNIGDIFAGFFKTILNALGSGIQQIGVQTLVAGKAIVALRKLFGTTAGIGASIGLIALGALIKGLAAKIKVPGFAGGVRNFAGGTALVGERGPELVHLPRGASVIPNAQTNSILGQQMVFIPDTILRGQDIVVSYRRASQSLNRTG